LNLAFAGFTACWDAGLKCGEMKFLKFSKRSIADMCWIEFLKIFCEMRARNKL